MSADAAYRELRADVRDISLDEAAFADMKARLLEASSTAELDRVFREASKVSHRRFANEQPTTELLAREVDAFKKTWTRSFTRIGDDAARAWLSLTAVTWYALQKLRADEGGDESDYFQTPHMRAVARYLLSKASEVTLAVPETSRRAVLSVLLDHAMRTAHELISSCGACIVSMPTDQMLVAAKSPTSFIEYGNTLKRWARMSMRYPQSGSPDCAPERQPLLDVSSMRAMTDTVQGIAFEVCFAGVPTNMIIKWSPLNERSRTGMEMAEAINATACSAARIAGRIPFFTATFCSFVCRIDKLAVKHPRRIHSRRMHASRFSPARPAPQYGLGVAAIQEFVELDISIAIAEIGPCNADQGAFLCLLSAAIVLLNDTMGIVHNDLHFGNIRCNRLNGAVCMHVDGNWYRVRSKMMPMIIDFGYSCDKDPAGMCGDETIDVFRGEGRPTLDATDARRAFMSIIEVAYTDCERATHADKCRPNENVFTYAVLVAHNGRRYDSYNAIEVLSAMCIIDAICSSFSYARGDRIYTALISCCIFDSAGNLESLDIDKFADIANEVAGRHRFIFADARKTMHALLAFQSISTPPTQAEIAVHIKGNGA
jgi:hypothetical protein